MIYITFKIKLIKRSIKHSILQDQALTQIKITSKVYLRMRKLKYSEAINEAIFLEMKKIIRGIILGLGCDDQRHFGTTIGLKKFGKIGYSTCRHLKMH